MFCSAVIGFWNKNGEKREKNGNKKYLCLRRKIGGNREKQ